MCYIHGSPVRHQDVVSNDTYMAREEQIVLCSSAQVFHLLVRRSKGVGRCFAFRPSFAANEVAWPNLTLRLRLAIGVVQNELGITGEDVKPLLIYLVPVDRRRLGVWRERA